VRRQTVCWCDTAKGEVEQRTLDYQRDDLPGFYFHLVAHRKPAGVAIVAVARKLVLRLYRMLRERIEYDEFRRRGRDARCARGRTEAIHA